MIELQQLTKRHRAGDIETTALDAIDLRIEAGEYVAITGPVGLRQVHAAGPAGPARSPDLGALLLQGEDVAGRGERELAALRRGRIGFVFQSFNLVDEMTVHDNVQLALRYGGLPEKAQRAARRRGARAAGPRAPRAAPSEPAVAAASSSAWRSRARSPRGPRCCSPTSPPATWTARTARR